MALKKEELEARKKYNTSDRSKQAPLLVIYSMILLFLSYGIILSSCVQPKGPIELTAQTFYNTTSEGVWLFVFVFHLN